MHKTRHWLYWVILASFLGGVLAGCGGPTVPAENDTAHELHMAPLSDMPDDVKSAPVVTQQAYQFAVANPQIMQQIPCYCGCGAMGHTSNYSCYMQRVETSGSVTFDAHALGCSICVDITQDAMRLTRQGLSPKDIRAYVDKTYSRYGPSNMQ